MVKFLVTRSNFYLYWQHLFCLLQSYLVNSKNWKYYEQFVILLLGLCIRETLKAFSWKYKNSLTGHILGNLTSNSNKIYKMTQKNYLKPPQTKLVSSFRLKVKIIKKKSCLIFMSILWRHIVNLKKNLFCRTILHTLSVI